MKQSNHYPLCQECTIFKDAHNAILYIGKAKSLKKRVASYFAKQKEDWKINALLEEYATIEHIVTHTESEALLLEVQMVKEYQPKYNTLLKSGNPFLYVVFTHEEIPQLIIVRYKNIKGTYFGPFIQKIDARRVHDYLIKTFQIISMQQNHSKRLFRFPLICCSRYLHYRF